MKIPRCRHHLCPHHFFKIEGFVIFYVNYHCVYVSLYAIILGFRVISFSSFDYVPLMVPLATRKFINTTLSFHLS